MSPKKQTIEGLVTELKLFGDLIQSENYAEN